MGQTNKVTRIDLDEAVARNTGIPVLMVDTAIAFVLAEIRAILR
ncbi:MAG: hypothetical protein WCO04_06065 [Pseudomonadota bacterium]